MTIDGLHLGDCLEVMPTLPAESVDAICTDPPYGIGFMSRDWDHGVPVERFWREMLRVAKPGAHLLAFGGTRTHHRLMCAIEDAGWEIRDCLGWIYGSGFPKSLDVSKAIDKVRRRDYVAAAIRLGMDIPGNSRHDWTIAEHSPSDEWWEKFKAHLPESDWRAIEREIVSSGRSGKTAIWSDGEMGEYDITAPATPEAAQWQGWGTALKPAWEPIVLARKPLTGTVAGNVLEHGTGALNVDGCRVEISPDDYDGSIVSATRPSGFDATQHKRDGVPNHNPAGRWPANIIHDGSDEVLGVFPETGPSSRGEQTSKPGSVYGMGKGLPSHTGVYGYNEPIGGSAARFFYCAKASKADRGHENDHPTVKPTELMRWLVRLVTPPNGIVLDPFMGSGSTGVACWPEGFDFIGIEQDEGHFRQAIERLEQAREADVLFTMIEPEPTLNGHNSKHPELFGANK